MQTRGPTLSHRTREGWGNQLRGIARPDMCLPAASRDVVFRSVFFYRPYGTRFLFAFAFPALKRWAIFGRPFGALSSGLGCARTAECRALPGFPAAVSSGCTRNQRQDQHRRQERCWRRLWFPPFAKEAKDGAPTFVFADTGSKSPGTAAVEMTVF
jgi:hypothetical protein